MSNVEIEAALKNELRTLGADKVVIKELPELFPDINLQQELLELIQNKSINKMNNVYRFLLKKMGKLK